MMNSSGLFKTRLNRLHDVMAGHVATGVAPGLVAVVSRRGEAHVDVIGATAMDGGDPMRRDSIFRISSMTKPITAVATMILLEECVVRLDEPVDRLLPQLADRRVVRRIDGPINDTVPANRPITVRDLLTFRMGFGGHRPRLRGAVRDVPEGTHLRTARHEGHCPSRCRTRTSSGSSRATSPILTPVR